MRARYYYKLVRRVLCRVTENDFNLCDIMFHTSDIERYSHYGRDAVQSGVNLLAFRSTLRPPHFSLRRWSQICTRLHAAAPS